jgi:hypothetical protein
MEQEFDVQQNMQDAEAFRHLRLQGTTNLQAPLRAIRPYLFPSLVLNTCKSTPVCTHNSRSSTISNLGR